MRTLVSIAVATAVALGGGALAEAKKKAGEGGKPEAPAKIALGANLLKNGNAEQSKGKEPTGWEVSTVADGVGAKVEQYGRVAGEWAANAPGAPNGGKSYFRIVFDTSVLNESMTQTVDLAPIVDRVQAGRVTAALSGYIGALVGSETTAQITVTFLDAAGKKLGTIETGAFDNARLPKPERGTASMINVGKSLAVPVKTTQVRVQLMAQPTGIGGNYVAFADNLSLVLDEPKIGGK